MKFRKIIFFVAVFFAIIVNFRDVYGENFIDIISDSSVKEYMVDYQENLMKFSYDEKTLLIDTESLANYELNEKNRIKEVFLIIENEETPRMILRNEKEILSIKQIEKGETYIFFGVPYDIEKTDKNIIYIVEHKNEEGNNKLDLVIKNNPNLEINFSGMHIMANSLKINKNSFENIDNFNDREIYSLDKNLATRLFVYKNSFLKIVIPFKYDINDKKGFIFQEFLPEYDDLAESHVDVTEQNCNKFNNWLFSNKNLEAKNKIIKIGYPGINSLGEIKNIDYSENNNIDAYPKIEGLDEIKNIENSENNNIDAENNIDKLKEYIKNEIVNIKNSLEEQENIYFMIFDKPNIETSDKKIIPAEDYAAIVTDAKNLGINLIMPGLELGKNETSEDKIRLNALNYYDDLFSNQEFLNSIDYLAVSINSSKVNGFRYCVNASRIEFYKNGIYCLDSFYAYRRILERQKEYSERELKIILFIEAEIENELIENLKADPYVEAVFIDKEVCNPFE